jgi:glycosyltransferase involved in cell wall biosynthesis
MKKISVVTVTYNASKDLEKTIESVISQTYFPHIEYIVIDGNSKDNTKDIIKKYEKYISHWTSEPDKGIYDAMNKGIHWATGEWINFMNAGDVFTKNTILEEIFSKDFQTIDIIYGNYIIAYQQYKKLKYTPSPLNDFYKGMIINHQSTFVKTILAKSHPYDTRLTIACDYEQLFTFYREGKRFQHVDIFVAEFAAGGASTAKKIVYLKECKHIASQYFPMAKKYYQKQIVYTYLIAKLGKIIPISVFEWLMKWKNRMVD